MPRVLPPINIMDLEYLVVLSIVLLHSSFYDCRRTIFPLSFGDAVDCCSQIPDMCPVQNAPYIDRFKAM
jgi:hypothetical protein